MTDEEQKEVFSKNLSHYISIFEVTDKTIGSGTVLQEKYFNIETGEPYEAEVSSDIAPVS